MMRPTDQRNVVETERGAERVQIEDLNVRQKNAMLACGLRASPEEIVVIKFSCLSNI